MKDDYQDYLAAKAVDDYELMCRMIENYEMGRIRDTDLLTRLIVIKRSNIERIKMMHELEDEGWLK